MADELEPASATEVAAARILVTTLLQEKYPRLSMRVGPLADLAVGPSVEALAAVDARAAADVASLDPETALAEGGYDETVLASALAGRGVTRRAASSASGSAAFVFSSDVDVIVPAGFRMATADGVYYSVAAQTRLLRTGSTVTIEGMDVVMTAVPGGGGYAGIVPIAAVETGADANRAAGTAFEADEDLSGQTALFAATDLSGGADAETDAELLARLPAATAARTTASAEGCAALVTDAYPFNDVYTAGFGDYNMRRGRSALTSQTPGRTDVRVRTDTPGRLRLPVTATLDSTGPGVWRFSINAGDAPGWYAIEKVLQSGANLDVVGYAPTQTTWGYDIDGVDPVPDIRSAYDAAGSVYSTALVKFADPDTSTVSLTVNVSTRSYDAIVRYVAGVQEAQDACNTPEALSTGGDVLVRAARPCAVSVSGTATASTASNLTAVQVAAAVAQAINQTAIGTRLYAQTVASVAQSLLPTGTSVSLTVWQGVIEQTDDTTLIVNGTDGLSVATDTTHDILPKTVAFYASSEDVDVTVTLS